MLQYYLETKGILKKRSWSTVIRHGEIKGVKIKLLKVHHDIEDIKQNEVLPGCLMEIYKKSDSLICDVAQSNFTIAHPGTIKAFHYHEKQDDLWFFVFGSAKVVLFDCRSGSKTENVTEIIPAGEEEYMTILIPRGVAHGYKVTSDKPCGLVYFVNQLYDPNDEKRIDPYDAKININWEIL